MNIRLTRAIAATVVPAIAVTAGAALVISPHWAVAAILTVGLGALCAARPGVAIPALLVYATVLGFTRRLVDYAFASQPSIDPLIIVLPLGASILGALAIRRGALRTRTLLTNSVLVLLGLAIVGALNPLQGSPLVGLAGLTFFGAPFLFFFVGRALCTDEILGRTYLCVAVTVFASSLYGLAQSNGRFTAFDRAWSESTNFRLGGELRPFGWSSSPGEYSRMLAVTIVIFVAGFGRERMREMRWFVIPALVTPPILALVLASVRSTVVYLVLALVAIAAAQRANAIVLVCGGVMALAALSFASSTLGGNFAGQSADPFVSRQLEGLANPTSSTATARFELLGRSLVDSIGQPIGQGTGVTTRASTQGDQQIVVTESDLGDAAVSWGLPGIVALGVFLAASLSTLLGLVRADRRWLAQAALAVFIVATLRWINGGLYPLAPLVLLGLGWADRQWAEHRATPSDAEAAREHARP